MSDSVDGNGQEHEELELPEPGRPGPFVPKTMEQVKEDLAHRDEKGRWMKGHRVYGGGKVKGQIGWKAKLARKMAESLTPDQYASIYRKVAILASKGDVQAAKLIFERGAGKPGMTPEPMDANLELPPLTDSKSIVIAAGIVVDAMASGILDPDHASKLLDAIEVARKAVDTHEVLDRLERLERDHDQMDRMN